MQQISFIPTRLIRGAYEIPVTLVWANGTSYFMDLNNQGNNASALKDVRSVWVDNSQGPTVTLQVDGQGAATVIPTGVQGYYPVFMATLSRIILTGSSPNGQTSFVFLDTETTGSVYQTSEASASTTDTNIASAMEGPAVDRSLRVSDDQSHTLLALIEGTVSGTLTTSDTVLHSTIATAGSEPAVTVTPRASTGQNFSVNAPAVSTLGTLLGTMAANSNRNACEFWNNSNTVAYLVRQNGGIIMLPASPGAGIPGGYWKSTTYIGSVAIYGAANAWIVATQD